MEYEPYDSSGTDDDLPQSHHNRVQRGHTAVNGRSALVGSTPFSGIHGENDMEAQIHHLEREAYTAVLRAFKAQADAITWEKESLITELRKELRVSNEEHRELLGKVNADDVIRRVREWRQGGVVQSGMLGASQSAAHDPISSPTVSASRKKSKANQSVSSQLLACPSPPFNPQVLASSNQPSSSAAKREAVMGSKGKKYKSDQVPPGASSMKSALDGTRGPSGRGQFSNKPGGPKSDVVDAVTCDRLIGRKVRTRWPDDNNFYEAIITDYNANEGLHLLVYDLGTTEETWEWVNLSEISPEDIQWEGEDPGISCRAAYDMPGHGANRFVRPDSIAGGGRGRGVSKRHGRKIIVPSQNGIGKKPTNDIRILHTDTLIKEVERIFGSGQPSPQQVDRVKKALKEHEQSLIDAIGRIADISDGEIDDHRQFLRGQ